MIRIIIVQQQGKDCESMRKEIETIYDDVYESVDQYLEKVRALQLLNLEDSTEEEKEKALRMELALQTAKDVLENLIVPGKKLTFMYESGSVTLEIFKDKKA